MKQVKKKLENHLMKNGKKGICEKLVLKSLKNLQKKSYKQTKHIVKLSLIKTTPIFKLQKIENKKRRKKNRQIKEIPFFILNSNNRISLAIKFILKSIQKKKTKKIFNLLENEILANAKTKGNASKIKDTLQNKVLLNKRFFYFYKWY